MYVPKLLPLGEKLILPTIFITIFPFDPFSCILNMGILCFLLNPFPFFNAHLTGPKFKSHAA